MIGLDNLLAFTGSALLLAFVPGPDNIFVMTQAAVRGWRAGLTVVLGLCTGLIVHTTAVALGVAVLFQQSQIAFDILKYAGSAYLLYLAWQAFRARPAEPEPAASALSAHGSAREASKADATPRTAPDKRQAPVANDGWRYYVRGIVMNITNPKVSIFFLAFLPQFVDQRAGHVTLQLFALGGLFILSTLIAFGFMAWCAAKVGARFGQSARTQLRLNRLAGVVFVGLAVKLALTQR